MKGLINESDSLIEGLCREIDYINFRSKSIRDSLLNCQNKILAIRLNKELNQLYIRRNSISSLSQNIKYSSLKDSLSIQLLRELIGRTLVLI